MNYIPTVAKMLNIKLDVPFKLDGNRGYVTSDFVMKEDGVYYRPSDDYEWYKASDIVLVDMLRGDVVPIEMGGH